jgi:hypothetical protein
MPDPADLFGSLLFGIIGMAAVIYGKKSAEWKPMLIGVALMAFPYLVSRTWVLYLIGSALTAALFVFRD